MGMYTGLRADLIIKQEFRPVIEELYTSRSEGRYSGSDWEVVAAKFPQYPFLAKWAAVHRADFLPFGALCYMPWDDEDPNWKDISFAGGRWVFQCSLKNYEDEIEKFCRTILDNIVEEVNELYSLYEEESQPTHLHVNN